MGIARFDIRAADDFDLFVDAPQGFGPEWSIERDANFCWAKRIDLRWLGGILIDILHFVDGTGALRTSAPIGRS